MSNLSENFILLNYNLPILYNYQARSAEYNTKAIINLGLFFLFLIISLSLLVLHSIFSSSGTSVFAMIYPVFFLSFLGSISFYNYRIRMLWNYILCLEVDIKSQLLNYDMPNYCRNINSHILPWNLLHVKEIRLINFYRPYLTHDKMRKIAESIVIAVSVIIIWLCSGKGFLYFYFNDNILGDYTDFIRYVYILVIFLAAAFVFINHFTLNRRIKDFKYKNEEKLQKIF